MTYLVLWILKTDISESLIHLWKLHPADVIVIIFSGTAAFLAFVQPALIISIVGAFTFPEGVISCFCERFLIFLMPA